MNPLTKIFPKLFGESREFLTPEEVQQLNESCRKSPDLWYLEQFEFQLLFCPDRTQRGHSEYSLIEDSAYMCHAFTQKKFNYWMQRDGLPIPMLATSDVRTNLFPPPLPLKGEVHAVRPWQFRELDNFKDNGGLFKRIRVKLAVPDRAIYELPQRFDNGKPVPLMLGQKIIGPEVVEPIKAWMYIGNPFMWDDVFDGASLGSGLFKTVSHYKSRRPWLKEYYELKKREEIIRSNR